MSDADAMDVDESTTAASSAPVQDNVTVEETTTVTTEAVPSVDQSSSNMKVDSIPIVPAQIEPEEPQKVPLIEETRLETGSTSLFPQTAPSPDVFSIPTILAPRDSGSSQQSIRSASRGPDGTHELSEPSLDGSSLHVANGNVPSESRRSLTPRLETSSQALPRPIQSGLDVQPIGPPASPARMVRTGYIYDPLMMLHCTDNYTPTADHANSAPNGHPEEPMRIKRIFSRLAEQGLISRMKRLDFAQVTFEEVLLVHTEDHWNKVQGTEILSDEYIQDSKVYYDQLSLYVCRETAHCARLSCGGVVQACMSVCNGEVRNAFAIVRPPGHHAEPEEHMGFCFYNNVAVAAKEVMRRGLAKRVLILDWDVHHGNGTQRAFWDDPDVLYISIHRHDGGRFYPTSDFGALDMVGSGPGEGRTINIPWPTGGFGDADYIYAFQKIVMPIAYEFAPDLVIISAGFDAAEGDVLGCCNVTPPAYGHMTHMLCALAGGKVVVALEGGYNLDAISRSSLAVAQVLLGETPAEMGALEASELATEVMYEVSKVQSKYWKSIDIKTCEPPEVTDANGEPPIIPIPDLLKIHRAHHMFTKHGLFQIPLASAELEAAFAGQIICSEGVYDAGPSGVMVVFVHDFGNLRVETDGVSTTNVHLTNSYLLDTSDLIVKWVVDSGYSIIDVNVLAQLPTQFAKTGPRMISKEGPKLEGQLIRYIWDNYIELSEAENIVLIGHGTACGAVMELINHRDVERKVKAVIQVAGLQSLVRIDPDNESRRDWFKKSNRIFVPATHPVLEDDRTRRRLGGQIFTSERAKVVDVLNDVLPQIQAFIGSQLPTVAIAAPNDLLANGHSDNIAGFSNAPFITA